MTSTGSRYGLWLFCMCSDGDVFVSELDQEIHESELANRGLFVQELLLLASTAADEGFLPREQPVSDAADNPRSSVTSQPPPPLNSVVKPATYSDAVVNCSTKISYLRESSSGSGLPRSGVGQSAGNCQRSSLSRDAATLPGAKR